MAKTLNDIFALPTGEREKRLTAFFTIVLRMMELPQMIAFRADIVKLPEDRAPARDVVLAVIDKHIALRERGVRPPPKSRRR